MLCAQLLHIQVVRGGRYVGYLHRYGPGIVTGLGDVDSVVQWPVNKGRYGVTNTMMF